MLIYGIACITLVLALTACVSDQGQAIQAAVSEMATIEFTSELLGESEKAQRIISVLLPPSYYIDEQKHYPVVYALRGLGFLSWRP